MTTYTWGIANLERETSDGYVFTAHWTLSATDGDHTAGSYGSIGFERPEGNLIPFENLTKELVIQWVQEKLGEEQVTSMEAALQAQIDEQKAPSKESGVPWNS
jgi:hypothetical protein